jgi:hypothetical protein
MPKRGIHLHVALVAGQYVYRKQKCGGESIFTLHDAPINSLRKHLFADLQPYVCPWDQCLGNTTTFRSRNAWVNHLGQEHTLASHWNGLACPRCLESVGDGLGAVSVHIARHLEDIALAAIPRNVDSDDGSNSEGDALTSAESINSDGPTMSDHQQRRLEHIIQDTGPSIPGEPHDLVNRLSRSCENQVTPSGHPIQPVDATKAPYIRPPNTKINCPNCNEYPDGFRGKHELNRHWQRAHAKVRTFWVTVDASPDKNLLAKCKQCRTGKKYGAYYNAAAHLRRAHFCRTKRDHKSKSGNKGRSDLPTVDDLMGGGWIKEITEVFDNTKVFDNDDVNDNEHNSASSELEDVAKPLPTSTLLEALYSSPPLHSSFLEDSVEPGPKETAAAEKSEYELVTEIIE